MDKRSKATLKTASAQVESSAPSGTVGAWEIGGGTLNPNMPLAARMRPRTLQEIIGQEHVLGEGKMLRRAIEADRLPSLVLWGPPGSGKTTVAQVIANTTQAVFSPVSATSAGVADLRRIVKEAADRRAETGERTILFIDEIHRFNKGQQDAILPHVEDGTVTLIGATTENPSFEVNSALLSRSRVIVLHPLKSEHLERIVNNALADEERGLGGLHAELTGDAMAHLLALSDGDARSLLNTLELAAVSTLADEVGKRIITVEVVEDAAQQRWLQYDRAGDGHYDTISALHKSVRDSDPDGSLYWLARMLEAGEDPLFVARRIIRMATEDIGMADPHALTLCMAAQQAVHFLGMPEGELALAEAVVYLSVAPKSNAVYSAYKLVKDDVGRTRNEPVPMHLRNAPTSLMKGLGYGQGYKYAHDFEGATVEQEHLPASLKGRRYYRPTERGHEAKIRQKLEASRQQGSKAAHPEEQKPGEMNGANAQTTEQHATRDRQ